MSGNSVLRFRLRKQDAEIELEGDFTYVKEKFEDLLDSFSWSSLETEISPPPHIDEQFPASLKGILERTSDGRPYLTVPFDILTSKEAVAFFLYALHPRKASDKDLSSLLTQGWKTTRPEAVRARASELRREGKLIAEDGNYTLSGAGLQWVEAEIISKMRKTD